MDNNVNITKDKIVNSFMWRLMERFGAQFVSLIVSVILARLLEPSAYGTVALVTIITNLLQVFVDSGMANALIQKKNADKVDFSSVFYFNLLFCILLYLLLFFCAPLIADFYKIPQLKAIVRVVGLGLIVSGIKNVQQAYVSKHMLFKKFFFSTLTGTLVSAFLGIYLAYKEFGVWALVFQHLSMSVVSTVVLWASVKWRPELVFSLERLKGLFSYGWKLLVAHFMEALYNDLRSLIIGKKYSTTDLSFYDKGKYLPSIIATNVNSSIDSVLLPAMSVEQDNIHRVKMMTRRAIKLSSYIMWPLMLCFAACAENVVSILLTDKWLPCVLYLRVYCITLAFHPIQTANLNAIKALGKSDIYLKISVTKKIFGFTLLFSTIWFGVDIMAYALIFESFVTQILNSWPNKKLLNYSYIEQIKDIIPTLLISVATAIIVNLVGSLVATRILSLIIQIIVGCVVYICASKIFHIDSFDYIFSFLRNRKRRCADS